jgi:hypothetical protein
LVTRGLVAVIWERQVDAAGVVGDAGGGHPDSQEEADGIDTEMALATCDLLARIDALAGRGHVGRGLDALGVQHAGARLGIPAFGLARAATRKCLLDS